MSHLNSKSRLNELCMKDRIPLPVYDTGPISDNGILEWKASLVYGGKKFFCISHSKKDAEQTLASHILKQYEKGKTFGTPLSEEPSVAEPPKRKIFSKDLLTPSDFKDEIAESPSKMDLPQVPISHAKKAGRIAVIIDLENIPSFPKDIKDLVGLPDLDIYAVYSTHYHGQSFAEVAGIKKIPSPALGANSSDLCIAMTLGSFLLEEKYDEYLLASRDKFVAPVTEIIRNGVKALGWKPKPAHVISTRAHLLEKIGKVG